MKTGQRSTSSESESRPLLRLERQLTESHTVLWTAVIVASAFDVVTTMTGLEYGLREGNSVARAFIETYGDPGVGLLKFVALVLLVLTWQFLPERPATYILTGFAFVSLLTVGLNAMTLLSI